MKIGYIGQIKEFFKKNKAQLKRSLGTGTLILVSAASLAGCGPTSQTENTQVVEETQATTEDNTSSVEEQIAALQAQIDALKESNGYEDITSGDTYTEDEWNAFVASGLTSLNSAVNNANEESVESAMVLLNVDYLDANGKDVMINHFKQGQDEESQIADMNKLISQIREHNTELDSVDDFYSFNNILLDSKDQAIMTVLEDYAKEVITLKQDLTKENTKKIQDIFDIMDDFFHGSGTIKVTIDGNETDIAKADLSNGGKVAAETVGQVVSVECKDIVAEEDRAELDGKLNTESLSEITKKVSKYLGITYSESLVINAEELENIVTTYNMSVDVLAEETKDMGVTEEEANALSTVCNIDMLINTKVGDNTPFAEIYKDGINIDQLYEDSESAVRKIQTYNDTHDGRYSIERFFLDTNDVQSYAFIGGYAETLENVASKEEEVSSAAVLSVKGFSQYSSEVTVDYETVEEDGTTLRHSVDKNGVSAGVKFVTNVMTMTNMENHASAYGTFKDIIKPLVDGSQYGLDPTDEMTLMITGECKTRNIAVYDYEIEAQK